MKKPMDRQSSKIYMKIFLTFTLSLSAAIFTVSMLLYLNFESITVQKDYSYIKGNLSQISYSASFMDSTVNNLLLQLSNDDSLSNMFMDYPPEAEDLILMTRRLNTYVNAIPFIHSIYVYNRFLDCFFIPGNITYGRNDFFDKEAVFILDNFNKYQSLSPIARIINNHLTSGSKDTKANVYTYVYYDPQFNKDINRLDKAIIFNINEVWIKDIIHSLDEGQENAIYIIDKNGTVVMGDSSIPMLTKLDKSGYLKNILKEDDTSGYFIHDVNHTKSLVTYVSLKTMDWKFVCITPYKTIIGKVNDMRKNTLLICLLLLVSGLILAWLLARKVYSPIDNILSNFKTLQSENKKGLLLQKQIYLKKAMTIGLSGDFEAIKKDFGAYEVKIGLAGRYAVILIQIDHFADFCSKFSSNDRDLYKFAIMNIASELLEEHNIKNESVDIGRDHVVLMINNPYLDERADPIKKTSLSIIQAALQYLQISVSVSISSCCNDIMALNKQYQEAIEASHYKLFGSKGSLVLYTDISGRKEKSFIYPIQKEAQLIDSLMVGNISSVKNTFDEIMDFAKDYSYVSFRMTITGLSTAINIAIHNLEKNNAIKMDFDLSLFHQKLEELEFFGDIRTHFFSIFEYISTKLSERKTIKYDELIARITGIINKHYQEPSLSLDSIAEMVGLSPSYISKIFKQFTTKTIIECITQTRLEAARNLLSTTDYSMNIISEKIGLNYSNYFYKLFKKAYGITPHEYKQSLTLNKNIEPL